MVLAAGMGTRLLPLTDDRPKALVTVGGRTLLEIVLGRLRGFGVREAVVNAHHFAEMICAYLEAHGNFGMRIEVSREEMLLDTGGGVKKAADFFLPAGRGEAGGGEAFVVHNVDVISGIDLGAMAEFHREQGGLATLAVARRETSRPLLFDGAGRLCGRPAAGGTRETEGVEALAFAGIHVVSPRIFGLMREEGAFSIIDAYLRLAAEGERVVGFRVDGAYWRDVGRVENLAEAERDMEAGEWRDAAGQRDGGG
jgi:NDP-sugar pyrophosphorylase family protein